MWRQIRAIHLLQSAAIRLNTERPGLGPAMTSWGPCEQPLREDTTSIYRDRINRMKKRGPFFTAACIVLIRQKSCAVWKCIHLDIQIYKYSINTSRAMLVMGQHIYSICCNYKQPIWLNCGYLSFLVSMVALFFLVLDK